MIPKLPYPVLDGYAPSWADIAVRMNPFSGPIGGVAAAAGAPLLEMDEIAAITSGATVELGEQRGPGGRVKKRTTGAVSQEASVTLYRSGFQGFLRRLKAAAPLEGNQRRIALVTFNVTIQHTPPGSVEVFERRIKGCRVTGNAMNNAEGTDADQVEVPLNPIQVVDMIDGEEVVLL